MWIVRLALRRPYTIAVMSLLILVLGTLSLSRMMVELRPSGRAAAERGLQSLIKHLERLQTIITDAISGPSPELPRTAARLSSPNAGDRHERARKNGAKPPASQCIL